MGIYFINLSYRLIATLITWGSGSRVSAVVRKMSDGDHITHLRRIISQASYMRKKISIKKSKEQKGEGLELAASQNIRRNI